jgi:hypothetical protein
MTMLAARLAVVERLHAAELALAKSEHARAAAALVRSKSHALGNAVQIARLASLQLEKRAGADVQELVTDLVGATEQATTVLGELLAAANPADTPASAPIVPAVRAALARIRDAIDPPIELACELPEDTLARATESELEALVLAALLAADSASRIRVAVRARDIAGKRYIQLLFCDDREDGAVPPLVEALAAHAGGEASLSPGRGGLELAIELPVA